MASRYSSEILAVITAIEWISTPGETVLRMALYGGMYQDTENPTGDPIHYQGRIKGDVVFDRKIGVAFWEENSEIDFGYIDLAMEDQDAELTDFATNVHTASVDLYRVNRSDVSEAELELIAVARSSDIGFTNEDTIRFRLESILQGSFDTPINALYYDDTYVEHEGKPYPIAWGKILEVHQLLPTLFVDPVYLLYHVTDLEITSFDSGVYDRGIELTELSPVEFVAADYGFTLNQNPDGKITAGRLTLVDPEDTSNEFLGLFRFVRLAMTRAGIWSNVDQAELTALESTINMGTAFPQFITQRVVSLQDFMNEIFNGVSSWYYVDELSEIHFGQLSDPDVAVPTLDFTDADVIGDIKVEDDKAPGLSTRLDYAESPGAYGDDEIAGGVTNDDRFSMTNDIHTVETTETIIPFFQKAAIREPIKLALSYGSAIEVSGGVWTADDNTWTADSIVYKADGYGPGVTEFQTATQLAQREVDRWWSELYHVHRHFFTFDVQINDPLFDDSPLPQLGEICTLQSDRFDLLETAKNILIRRVKFNFSTGLLTIEGWG